jgi:hypothetical protein
LEFDDVILFDFFDDEIAVEEDQWSAVMKKLEVIKVKLNQERKVEDLDEEKGLFWLFLKIKIKDFQIDEEVELEALDAEIISSKAIKNQVYNPQDITVFNCQNNRVSVKFQQIVSKPDCGILVVEIRSALQ